VNKALAALEPLPALAERDILAGIARFIARRNY